MPSLDLTPFGPPKMRKLTVADLKISLALGLRDFRSFPAIDICLASVFVTTGLLMTWITVWTGETFWLVLAVLGFPMIGTLAALGFYEVSRQSARKETPTLSGVVNLIWRSRRGQVPWLAAIIIVIFLFWFFLAHMIFALFLGLTPMTHISTSFQVFFTDSGIQMLFIGTTVGAAFSVLVFALSVYGMPMLLDRNVDFITAMICSISTVLQNLSCHLAWGAFIGVVTLLSVVPLFLGLFFTMPILGHASWHLYTRLTQDLPVETNAPTVHR